MYMLKLPCPLLSTCFALFYLLALPSFINLLCPLLFKVDKNPNTTQYVFLLQNLHRAEYLIDEIGKTVIERSRPQEHRSGSQLFNVKL